MKNINSFFSCLLISTAVLASNGQGTHMAGGTGGVGVLQKCKTTDPLTHGGAGGGGDRPNQRSNFPISSHQFISGGAGGDRPSGHGTGGGGIIQGKVSI